MLGDTGSYLHQGQIYQLGAGGCTPASGVRHPLEETLVFHIRIVNTYYIETIAFRIREKIFEHKYGRSPYNVALVLIFAQNTSTVRSKPPCTSSGRDLHSLQSHSPVGISSSSRGGSLQKKNFNRNIKT
jgi:hypothetical protein